MNKKLASFADLTYRVLVKEKRAVLKDLADELGLKYPSLYARLRGRVPFRPAEVRGLIQAVPDPRFIAYFLDQTPYIAVQRVNAELPSGAQTLLEEGLEALEAAVQVVRSLEHGARNGGLTEDEIEVIDERLSNAEGALATLRTRFVRTCRPEMRWPARSAEPRPNEPPQPRED